MEKNTNHLMKHFATVLRNRATGKQTEPTIDKTITRYLSRKELIEIIKKKFNGSIPKEHNLLELENEELLTLIEDELFIISFVTEKWSKEGIKSTVTAHIKLDENKKEEIKKIVAKPDSKK